MIQIENLRLSFGDNEVLHGVSCDVSEREVVCIIGASGSGKSTLLRCMNGLERPSHGSVIVNGHALGAGEKTADLAVVRRDVGMVFQHFNLFPHMTVLDNVALAQRRVLKRTKSESHDRARALLDRVGLTEKADVYPDSLSCGQKQRVAIAPCARDGSEDHALRRAHVSAGPRDRRRGSRRDEGIGSRWNDHGGGDPRNGLRTRGGRPRHLYGPRRHHRDRGTHNSFQFTTASSNPRIPEQGVVRCPPSIR